MFKVVSRFDGIVRTVYSITSSSPQSLGNGSFSAPETPPWFLVFVNSEWRWLPSMDFVPYYGEKV